MHSDINLHFFYVCFSVFSLCSADMFGHNVRELCSGLSGSMFDWTLCSGICSNVHIVRRLNSFVLNPMCECSLNMMFGSHFGSECSKGN